MITLEPALVACKSCNKEFERKRSPRKGYKVTTLGVLCDDCYATHILTTVYEYGCGDEFYGGYDGVEFAVDQMRHANFLWNVLVEIDRYNGAEYHRLTTDPALEDELNHKNAALEALNATIQKQKVQERKKKVQIDPEIAAEKKQLQGERKDIYVKLRAQRAKMKSVNQPLIDALNLETEKKIEAATDPKSHGLPWTMVEPIKARFKTASARAQRDRTTLKFHRFDGSGIITAPFTNGLPLGSAYRNDEVGKFQISPGLMTTHPREKRTQCRIAVASATNRKPVWLTLPVIFHRPLPLDSDIRNVTVRRELLAGKAHWKMCITVRIGAVKKATSTLACALDIGWRKRPDGSIRVAYLVDEHNHTEELLLPSGDMDQFRKLDDLKSIMENNFNAIRNTLATGLKALTDVPQPLRDEFQQIVKWRSPGRLVHAMNIWVDNRFEGDQVLWDAVQHWYHGARVKPDLHWNGHRHLYLWWVNLNDQLQRKRREQYRVFAAGLARKYGKIFLEEFDLRNVAKTPEPERDLDHDKEARYQRTKAATSVLRSAIQNVCSREGLTLDKIDSMQTTHECPVCGSYINFDAAKNLMCRCDSCGGLFDQDYIGAKNVLDRGLHPDKKGTSVVGA
jgi:hypothetical protein